MGPRPQGRWVTVSLLQDRMAAPRHHGPMSDATHVGAVGNPACGDVVTLYVRLADDRIQAASFESIGSPYQLATADVLCDCIQGQAVADALRRGPDCVLDRLPDLPAKQRYLARLAIDALHRAFDGGAHSTPTEDAAGDWRVLDDAEAAAFVKRCLRGAKRLRTLQVHALAEAEGVRLPGSTLQCLASLRREGAIAGEMDLERKTWCWWV